MPQSFFIWNGVDCRSKGVTMRGPAPIIRAEERVSHTEIPGRSGDVTETEGENIYNSYIQTVSISVRGGYRVRDIYKWLRGAGYVTFSGEPDKKQKARVIGAITLNRISRNMDRWAGEVQFYCQPYKELLHPQNVTITSSGSTVRNNGDVDCKPRYRVTVAGSGSGKSVSIVVSGARMSTGNTIAVTGLTGGHTILIDSEIMEIWDETGQTPESITKQSTGEFPVLEMGNNTITGTGWSEIEINKMERYL